MVTRQVLPHPLFFVSAESKRVRVSVSCLESTLVESCVSVDCKGLAGVSGMSTSLLAEELTEKAGRGAVSENTTAATITQNNTVKLICQVTVP